MLVVTKVIRTPARVAMIVAAVATIPTIAIARLKRNGNDIFESSADDSRSCGVDSTPGVTLFSSDMGNAVWNDEGLIYHHRHSEA